MLNLARPLYLFFMKRPYSLLVILFLVFSKSLFAQEITFEGDGDTDFFIGISPVILPKEGIEVNFVNSLTSFWVATHNTQDFLSGIRNPNRIRFTFFDQLLQVYYGFDSNNRWDLGAQIRYTHLRLDNDAQSSPFKVLGEKELSDFGENFTAYNDRGITMAGLRFRVAPFENISNLTLQGVLDFPIAKEGQLRDLSAINRPELGLIATYYIAMGDQLATFLQGEWRFQFSSEDSKRLNYLASTSGYLIFDIVPEVLYIFPGLSYSNTLTKSLGRTNYQLLGSLGLQLRPGQVFSIFANVQVPFIFESGNPLSEWVRESYSGLTLGVRAAF